MSDYKRKRKTNYRNKRPSYDSTISRRGSGGGRSYQPSNRLPPYPIKQNNSYTDNKFMPPKHERHPYGNGRNETWTEPQKPREYKTIKYEVDTDKLLSELSRGNKETLEEITERLREENSSKTEEITDEILEPNESKENTIDPTETEATKDLPELTKEELEKEDHDILDDPEMKYMSPSFWEDLEAELGDDIGLEPERPIENTLPDEEPTEGYY